MGLWFSNVPDRTEGVVPSWVNGVPDDQIALSDRGLNYGDGVFETLRVTRAGPVLMDYHLQRLKLGLERLQIPCDWPQLEQECLSYPGLQQPGVVKIRVTRGLGGRGYQSSPEAIPNRIITCYPAPSYPDWYQSQGISVFPCVTRLATNEKLAGIKHLNRLEQVLARQEWQGTDYQEGLMCNHQGHPVEGIFSNLFVVGKQQVLTPDLRSCGVAGTLRAWLLDHMTEFGITPSISSLSMTELQSADELFMCNSLYGIWPVTQLGSRRWPVGAVSGDLIRVLAERFSL